MFAPQLKPEKNIIFPYSAKGNSQPLFDICRHRKNP